MPDGLTNDLPYIAPGTPDPPLNKAALTKSIGGPILMGVRSIASGSPASHLDPQRLARILKEAEMGDAIAFLELAEQMEELDPHYRSVLGTRKFAVTQLKFTVEPASDKADDVANAKLLEDWLKRDELEEELFDILDGIGKGFSMTEIIWETSASQWMPKSLEWRDPRWWIMDRIDGVTPLMRDLAGFLPRDPYKWIYHRSKSKSGLPIRGGLARGAAWYWMFKNYSVKDWVAFAEVFGMPLRLGKYEVGETEENITALMRAVANMGSDAAAVIAKSMDIEFVDAGKGSGAAPGELYQNLCNYCDTQMSKLVLGQTATTDAIAGGHAVGKTHNEVRGDLKRADKAQLQATLNRDLARAIVFLNRGEPAGGVYPRFVIDEEDDPLEVGAMSAALGLLVPLGLKVKTAEVMQRMSFTPATDDDEILMAPAPPPPPEPTGPFDPKTGKPVEPPADPNADPSEPKPATPSVGQDAQGADVDDAAMALASAAVAAQRGRGAPDPRRRLATAFSAFSGLLKRQGRAAASSAAAPQVAASTAPDAIDHGIDDALSDWKPLAKALTGPIEDLVAGCSSLEEVRDKLAEQVDAISVEEVAQLLAQSSFASRLAGKVGGKL